MAGRPGFFTERGTGSGWRFTSSRGFRRRRFKVGHVLTVEPGLYYPGLGGVRTEDLVALTKSGIKMLSNFEHRLEL